MSVNSTISFLKIALYVSAIFLLFPNTLKAQKGIIELLPGTKKLAYDDVSGAQKLIGGGVNMNYEGNKVYADSIFYFEQKKLVKGYGHVQITKNDSLNLYCDSIWYFTDTQKAKLYSRVRVVSNDYVLTTRILDYDAKTGLASYQNNGKIENLTQNEVLTSKRGYLYPNEKNFHFSESVRYRSDSLSLDTDTLQYRYLQRKVFFYGPTVIKTDSTDMYCKKGWFNTQTQEGVLENDAYIIQNGKQLCGDSLYINDKEKIAIGRKNVHFIDTLNKVEFTSQKANFSNKEHFGYVTDSVQIVYRLKEDTIYIHSDSMLVHTDSSSKIQQIELFWDVQIYGTKIQASCDSLVMNKVTDKITLFRDPILWSQNSELKADTMHVYMNDSVISKVELVQRSTVIMELDSGNYYNQVGGKNIDAFFSNNELIRVEVNQNAQTNYFPQDTLRSDTLIEIQRKGMTRLYASSIKVYLDSGEVLGITYYKNPDGVFYPLKDVPKEEQFIANFFYFPEFRPISAKDIFRKKRYFKKTEEIKK